MNKVSRFYKEKKKCIQKTDKKIIYIINCDCDNFLYIIELKSLLCLQR